MSTNGYPELIAVQDFAKVSLDGFCLVDTQGRFKEANPAYCDLIGYSRDELLALTVQDLEARETPEEISSHIQEILTSGRARYETAQRRKDGTIIEIEISASLIKGKGGKVFLASIRDLTDRKKYEEEIKRNYDIQSVMNSLLRLSLEDVGLQEILEQAINLILSIPRLALESRGAIFLVEGDDPVLILKGQRGISKTLQERCARVPFGTCLCGRAALSGKIEFSDCIDKRHDIYFEGMIPHGHYCIPILFSERVMGVINLYLKEGHIREAQEEEFLMATANTLAGIIIRKQSEEAFREKEERFRVLFNLASDSILLLDASNLEDPVIVDANIAAHSIHGYLPGELIGKPISFLNDPQSKKQIPKRMAHLMTGNPLKGEAYHVRKDGWLFPIEISAQMIQIKGEPYIQVIDRDITERKQSEEKIQKTLEKLRKAMGGTIQVICQTVEMRDPYTAGHQRRVADLSRTMAQELGLSEQLVDGLRIAGVIHDLGKFMVPVEILSKPTELNPLEYSLIKEHAQAGYDILKGIEFPWPIAQIVLQHHERLDGSGYPQGLKGEAILMEARILAVADVVEAIASHRPYRPAQGIEKALAEIATHRSILYDPNVVDVCLRLFREKGFAFD